MAQGRIVSKKELEDFKGKYGQNMELRDLLNKERGLTRRRSKPITQDIDPEIAGQPMTKEESAKSMDRSGRLNSLENTDLEGMSTFSHGGKVGSASKRADGIAQRGKTRGKVC